MTEQLKAGDYVALVKPWNLSNKNRIARLVRPRPPHWEHTSAPGPRWEVDRPFKTTFGAVIHSLPVCNIKRVDSSAAMEYYVREHDSLPADLVKQRVNYKAPLIAALGDAGYLMTESFNGHPIDSARTTFTQPRKDGTRRIKLWWAGDVFASPRAQQLKLEKALKARYGDKYLHGYFIPGACGGQGGTRSFCVIIRSE